MTDDPECVEKLECLRNHGSKPKYYHRIVGGNFRLDALQAAVVTVKLRHLDGWTAARQSNARRYDTLLAESGLMEKGLVAPPQVVADRHIFNQYVVRAPRRDALRAFLGEREIGTEVYYPVPLHLQECFAGLGYRQGDLPHSEEAALGTLALPIYPEVSDEQAKLVVDSITEFYA